MSDEKLCQKFLRAAAALVRKAGLARGRRRDKRGRVCMLGALDHCGISLDHAERTRIEKHLATILPRPPGDAGWDNYNKSFTNGEAHSHIAWWSNMKAKDAEEIAEKLELAAANC